MIPWRAFQKIFNKYDTSDNSLTRTTIFGLLVLAIGLSTTLILAEAEIPSPLKQFQQSIPIEEIQCRDTRILMSSPSGRPACVYDSSVGILEQRGFIKVITANRAEAETDGKQTTFALRNENVLLPIQNESGVEAIHVPGKGKITYADIPPLSNSGGFWYPVTIEQAEEIMERVAATTDRNLRLSATPHPYLPDHAYYNVPYTACYYMDDGYCLLKSRFLVSYDSSSHVTSIDYRLDVRIWDADDQLDLLKNLAGEIDFDVKREVMSTVHAAVYAADGGELRAHIVFSDGGTWTEVEINGWSNEFDWPELMSDHELSKIANEFTTRHVDLIDPEECRYFVQNDSVVQDQNTDDETLVLSQTRDVFSYKYMNGGIPVLRVVVGWCEDPWFRGEQPTTYTALYGNIDRLTGTVVYFEPLDFLVDDWIDKIDLPDKHKVIFGK